MASSELAPALIGADPTNLGDINRRMGEALMGHNYAKSPLDVACWDIYGKAVGRPVVEVARERHDVAVADRDGLGRRAAGALQGGAVDEEATHAEVGVVLLEPGAVAALGRPDPLRAMADAHRRVVEAGAQREALPPGVEQRLERMRRGATEQLERAGAILAADG